MFATSSFRLAVLLLSVGTLSAQHGGHPVGASGGGGVGRPVTNGNAPMPSGVYSRNIGNNYPNTSGYPFLYSGLNIPDSRQTDKAQNELREKTIRQWKQVRVDCDAYLQHASWLYQRVRERQTVDRSEGKQLQKAAGKIQGLLSSIPTLPQQLKPDRMVGDHGPLPTNKEEKLIAQSAAAIEIAQYLRTVSGAETSGVLDVKHIKDLQLAEYTVTKVANHLKDVSRSLANELR